MSKLLRIDDSSASTNIIVATLRLDLSSLNINNFIPSLSNKSNIVLSPEIKSFINDLILTFSKVRDSSI